MFRITEWLLRHFIKDYKNINKPVVRNAVGRFASWMGIIINLLLVAAKIIIGLLSGSLAVIADGLNNLMDAAASIITLAGFKISEKKADKEHPFGHGRYEYISGFVVSLIGMKEIYQAFMNKGMHPQKLAGYLAIVLFYIQNFFFEGSYNFFYVLLAIVLLLSILVWKPSVKPDDIAVTMLGLLYPGILLSTAGLIKEAAHLPQYYLLYMTLAATYGTDTFAYFSGRLLGKRKLCPVISPNKTVEGSVGGLVGGIFLVMVLGIVLNWVYNINVHPFHFAMFGLLGGVFSQIGDLTASSIKRYCNIKDFGNLIPGHGGILDRIDSLLFVLPVVYIYSQLVLMG